MQDEELTSGERDHIVLQSVDETSSEPLAIHRIRPVEQGCLKRPVGRKVGRQESVEELDKEKLKFKMVVRRQDWTERRESLQKQDSLHDSDSQPVCADERGNSFLFPIQSKTQNSSESSSLESKASSTTLKDVLYKKLSTRASEANSEPSSGSCESEGTSRSASCSTHTEWQHCRLAKDNMKPDRLDFKAPNIEFTRKRLSFEEREDCMCRLSSGLHENLHFGSMRSKSLQLDTAMSHDHMKGSLHSSPEGLPPKLFSGRGESAVEKLQLISAEAPLRKTSSEYKLEGRHVSSLKPLEGTLDIGFLSGPRVSKTETCLSKMADNTSDTVSVSPSIWLKSPTEKQITIPHLKSSDKIKTFTTCSPSSEAFCPKEQSTNAAVEIKMSKNGEKTQEKHREPLKPSVETFTVKQEGRPAVKASSSLAHRHSSQFSSAGKTPSIREVSNEDQEDEVEQQEVTPNTSLNSNKTSLISAQLEVHHKDTEVETPAEAAADEAVSGPLRQSSNSSLDTGQHESCVKTKAAVRNVNMTSVSEVTAQNVSAPHNEPSKQKPLNICFSNTHMPVSVTTAAFKPECENKPSSLKSKFGCDTYAGASNISAVRVAEGTGSSVSKVNTCGTEMQQNKDVRAGNMSSSLNFTPKDKVNVNKNYNTVSACTAKDKWQKKEVNVLSKNTEAAPKDFQSEKMLHKSLESECKKENAVVLSAQGKGSASVFVDENMLSSKCKSLLDPEPATAASVKEVKPLDVKSDSSTSPDPVVKWTPNSKVCAAVTSTPQPTPDPKHKEVLLSSGGGVKPAENVQLMLSTIGGDVKQRVPQSKGSATIKNNADSKSKCLLSKTLTATPTCVAKESLDVKPKDPSLNQFDAKPKDDSLLSAPQLHQLRKEQPSNVSSSPDPPLVPPKPAVNKDTHTHSSGEASGTFSSCEAEDEASKNLLKADSQKVPDTKILPPDKHPLTSKREQADKKKKDMVQESALKSVKKDSSRASPSASKHTSDKESSSCKRQQESPRSSCNKK